MSKSFTESISESLAALSTFDPNTADRLYEGLELLLADREKAVNGGALDDEDFNAFKSDIIEIKKLMNQFPKNS